MEQWIHLAQTLYMQYAAKIVPAVLVCIAILMIITLVTVRRCKKQVVYLNENTKELMKYSMRRAEAEALREKISAADRPDAAPQAGRERTREDEEVFGSVIQEMFS